MELLDVVLEKALLFWILNILNFQRDEDVIRALALVDFCWFQRITKRKFKTRIWLRLQGIIISFLFHFRYLFKLGVVFQIGTSVMTFNK